VRAPTCQQPEADEIGATENYTRGVGKGHETATFGGGGVGGSQKNQKEGEKSLRTGPDARKTGLQCQAHEVPRLVEER